VSLERVKQWERQFAGIMHKLDGQFEVRYGEKYPLHSAKPERGSTTNPRHSGLFSISGKFSTGFRSKYGPGYVLEVRISTLAKVPDGEQRRIEDEVAAKLRELLARDFPDMDLSVERDGRAYTIFGDLSLGTLQKNDLGTAEYTKYAKGFSPSLVVHRVVSTPSP
jgi:hypothetical protein